MLSWKPPSFPAGNTMSISSCAAPLPVWSSLVNYITLAHLLKCYLVSKLKHPNPTGNANNISETLHPNPLRSRKKANPHKTGIHQSNKTSPVFFLPSSNATQSWLPRAQQAAATCQQQIIKMLSWWRWKTSHLPSLRIYAPTASTVPACQYSPIAFIVFIP